MQLVMLGNYVYMVCFSLVVQPRILAERIVPLARHVPTVVARYCADIKFRGRFLSA